MARRAPLIFTALAALAVAAASASAYARAADGGDLTTTTRRGGAVRLLVGDELALGVAVARRRMQDVNGTGAGANDTAAAAAAAGYISYGALRADSVPCDQRGASYYNCRPGAEANPYTRGCSAITQCRG